MSFIIKAVWIQRATRFSKNQGSPPYLAWHNTLRSVDEQKAACQSHRFIPALLMNFADAVDADTEGNSVTYWHRVSGNTFINGLPPTGYESIEIHACADKKALGDASVQRLRAECDARIAA